MLNEIPSHIRSGIYKILNTTNGHFYIGSAVNIVRRFRQHKHDLIHNRHRNSILQASFNRYGEASFVFQLVEAVPDLKLLVAVEQRYLDLHCDGKVTCYNIATVAESSLGIKRSPEAIERGRLARKKILASGRGTRKGIPTPEAGKILLRDTHFGLQNNLGTVYSEETKSKISAAKKGISIHRKKYCVTFVDPLGIVHPDIRDVKNFARTHGLFCDGLYKLVNGKYEVYHGWKTSSVVVL